ncbi:MAG: DUF2971 domain-containing protein [Brumimicrobium sp.]|nr:DUF2971 domain-containing protein [Brumimicrobium sp.]
MKISELIKIGVKNGQYPQHLYRFRQLDDKFNGILENSAMWFSRPNSFNDPFDCTANLEHDYPQNTVIKWFEKQGMSIEELKDCSITEKQLKEIIESTVQENISKSYVCCFAEKNDNLLMWSHYTNGHTGVCLKFDITEDTDFFCTPIHVNYSESYPKENYIKNENKTINSILTTKAIDWQYEKEIRVIKPSSNQNKFTFKKTALREIIFGCKTEPQKINEIIDLVNKSGFSHVKFSQAIMDSNEYKLNFKSI